MDINLPYTYEKLIGSVVSKIIRCTQTDTHYVTFVQGLELENVVIIGKNDLNVLN